MKIGDYEFEWVPDEMVIPRPEKTVAVVQNLGNVGVFSWGPQLIGKEVVMKWKFVSKAQYAALLAMFLAGGVFVLDLSSSTIFVPPPEGGTPVFQPYPDPDHPGVLPGSAPPYKRFYFGPVHGAPFTLEYWVYWNWSVLEDNFADGEPDPDYMEGYIKVLNVADPANAYMEIAPISPGPPNQYHYDQFPNFRVGDCIATSYSRATVVPWDPDLRARYLYPNPPSESDKIYYKDVTAWPPPLYQPVASSISVGDVLYVDYSENGYVMITEMGSDDPGPWFRCRPATDWWAPSELITWCAGDLVWVDSGDFRQLNIIPWGLVDGGPFR